MPLQPNTKYEATVQDCQLAKSKTKQTDALWFKLNTEDGPIDHWAYITPATVVRLKETMYECFGITAEELMSMDFLLKIVERVRGDIISITTDEGNGDYPVKVQWMNPAGFKPKKPEPVDAKRVASIFGGGPVSSPAYRPKEEKPAENWAEDESVPF